jgi:RNA polymerase sigma-70 factor, ECF subfamily
METAMATRAVDEPDDLAALAHSTNGGDRAARERLVGRLLPRARNLVRYLVGNDSEVDDFAQIALLTVVRGLKTFSGTGSFAAWADRVVARAVFAELRRRKRPVNPIPAHEVPDPSPDDAQSDYIARRWLARLLERLPVEQRVALVLHFVVGMTVPEIAAQVAAPAETVRSRLRHATERLRSLTGQTLDPSDESA